MYYTVWFGMVHFKNAGQNLRYKPNKIKNFLLDFKILIFRIYNSSFI